MIQYSISNIANLDHVPSMEFVTSTDKAVIAACRIFGVKAHHIRSARRTRRIAGARMAIYWALLEGTGLTTAQIAGKLNRDQSTVRAGAQRCEVLRERIRSYRRKTDELLQVMG